MRRLCTSWSLSELDSVSLAPGIELLSAGVGEKCELCTATIVPSSVTWDVSVILSIPAKHSAEKSPTEPEVNMITP